MMHQHGAHAIRALPPTPLTEPRPGDLPGWTGEPISAPDPRTAVHRGILHPAAPPVVKQSLTTLRRPAWSTAIAIALICTCLGAFLATLGAIPTPDATRIAVRDVAR